MVKIKMSNKNIREIAIDKQLESMSKSLKQLSSNCYADNFTLSRSIFTLASFIHKMLVAYNQDDIYDQTEIFNQLALAYAKVQEELGARQVD